MGVLSDDVIAVFVGGVEVGTASCSLVLPIGAPEALCRPTVSFLERDLVAIPMFERDPDAPDNHIAAASHPHPAPSSPTQITLSIVAASAVDGLLVPSLKPIRLRAD